MFNYLNRYMIRVSQTCLMYKTQMKLKCLIAAEEFQNILIKYNYDQYEFS